MVISLSFLLISVLHILMDYYLDVAFTCEFIRKNFINESKLIVLINAVRSVVHASL